MHNYCHLPQSDEKLRTRIEIRLAENLYFTQNPPDRGFACKRMFSAVTNLTLL